jgi:hypothetical protein
MKKKTKKLVLARETVRRLEQVGGGVEVSYVCTSHCTGPDSLGCTYTMSPTCEPVETLNRSLCIC